MVTTAKDIKDALHRHWPSDQYLVIEEAPEDAARMGRKIDLLVVSYWRSRGHTLDAVEVKASMTDVKRELDGYTDQRTKRRVGGPAKADFWWSHSDRFWLAVPELLATKIMTGEMLPDAWGLIAITYDLKVRVVVKAPKHARAPMTWETTVGVMRSATQAGVNALARARDQGVVLGMERAQAKFDRESGHGLYLELRDKVKAAEEATGVPIEKWGNVEWLNGWASTEEVQRATAEVLRFHQASDQAKRALEHSSRELAAALKRVEKALASE